MTADRRHSNTREIDLMYWEVGDGIGLVDAGRAFTGFATSRSLLPWLIGNGLILPMLATMGLPGAQVPSSR